MGETTMGRMQMKAHSMGVRLTEPTPVEAAPTVYSGAMV